MWNRKRETGARLTSRSAGTSSAIEPVPGHSAIRTTTSSVASRNSLPSPGRCSSNQTAATCSSSSASAENSIGSVTERAWRGLAHVPRATVVPDPRRTVHVVRVARVPSPTQHVQRRGRRARPDRGSRGGRRRTRRGDPLEGSARHAGVCRDRRSRPTGYSRCEAAGSARRRLCEATARHHRGSARLLRGCPGPRCRPSVTDRRSSALRNRRDVGPTPRPTTGTSLRS